MKVHFIEHEKFEAPGAYLTWAKQRNHDVTFSKIYENQPIPNTADDFDLLIIMGGPQSPDSTRDEYPYFDAKAEIKLIQKTIIKNKAIVGVCLGSQLIGDALGGKYEPSPEKEIGIFPIKLTEDGLKDEKLNHFGSVLNVGHWHSDMPSLTLDSKVLATSAGCPRQIIAYSNLVYGFQCHLELTKETVELLIAEDLDLLTNNSKYKYIQKPNEIRNYDYSEMNNKLFKFLDYLVIEFKRISHE